MTNHKSTKSIEKVFFKLHQEQDGVIYKYVPYDTALKIIENSSLLYTNPEKFNDPFDLTSYLVDLVPDKVDIKQFVEKHIKSEEIKKEFVSKFIDANLGWFSKSFADVFDEGKKNIGITCFSKSPFKTLMWSHYAEKHSGVCIGFSFKNSAGDGLIQMEVNYADKIVPMSFYKNQTESIYNWLFTKSKIWEYEEEVRRLLIKKVGLIEFNKNELCEIYYGLKMDSERIDKIQRSLMENNYKLKKQSAMDMDKETFDLKERIMK